jgi:hypothetical protein
MGIMNALIGSVKVLPVNEYTVWYSPSGFPTISTDAVLIDGEGELLLINPGWGYKIISVQQVRRIVTARIAENEELHTQEMVQYESAERE